MFEYIDSLSTTLLEYNQLTQKQYTHCQENNSIYLSEICISE